MPLFKPLLTLLASYAALSDAAGIPATQPAAADPTVTICNGVLIGTATSVMNQPEVTGKVNAYLGVPFAASPTRFAPPVAATPWTEPLKVQTMPNSCPQKGYTGLVAESIGKVAGESEDCLYANIFAPESASPANLKPVLFWIHGGNLVMGTAGVPLFNGSSLAANEDVVIVAINYRTNLFGFSYSPELAPGLQNLGFLDQRLALRWVQQNIRAFGGDPQRVTIFGESAGGYSVKQLLANPPSPLPYRAAIMQSQMTLQPGNARASYLELVANFGCLLTVSPLSCLRKVPLVELQAFMANKSHLVFPPVDDGITQSDNVLSSIVTRKFANVPIYIGTNKDEGTLLAASSGLSDGKTSIKSFFKVIGLDITPILPSLEAAYSINSTDTFALVSQIFTDLLYTCTTLSLSDALQKAGYAVWRYRYDASFPNLQLYNRAGAYHGSELPQVWGTYELQNRLGSATEEQKILSRYMQQIWAGFARDPLQGTGWPKLGSAGGEELGRLGSATNATGLSVVPLSTADFPCGIYLPVLQILNLAY